MSLLRKFLMVLVLTAASSGSLGAQDVDTGSATVADCAELNAELAEHIRAGRYAKPDGGNAMLALVAVRRAGCELTPERSLLDHVDMGIISTKSYLTREGRLTELCPILAATNANATPDAIPFFGIAIAFGDRPVVLQCLRWAKLPAAENPVTASSSAWTATDERAIEAKVQNEVAITPLLRKFLDAVGEERFYAPAGENAIEYALRIRDTAREKEYMVDTFDSALTHLAPYALIAAEQAAARRDRAEFDRLYALLLRIDPNSAALQRLSEAARDW